MDKTGIVEALKEIGVLLTIQGENPFKVRAYENGARALESESAGIDELIDSGRLGEIKGIGKELEAKIITLARSGTLPYHEELKEQVPPGLLDMLRIPGLGPKRAKLLHDELGLASLDDLERACNDGSVASVKGFTAKGAAKLLEGIAYVRESSGKLHHARALPHALALLEYLKEGPGVLRAELAGSLRRGKEIIKDIDLVVSAKESEPVMEHFTAYEKVAAVTGQGPTKSSIRLENGLAADLRVVDDEAFPYALHHFTGSKEHNTAMRALAKEQGLKMNEYGLWRDEERIACKDEAELFRALGLDEIAPELREDTGEIDAARKGELPELVCAEDIVGLMHVHTTYSDGVNTLAEMRDEAARLGYQYLLICDHSQGAAYAGGLKPKDVLRQREEIDRLNGDNAGLTLLKGIEVDILADGNVDYDDELLEGFDLVIASVHSGFQMDERKMTERICRALANPHVDMLGHPTGRLLLSRDGYPLDIETMLQTAKEHGKAVELNAHPYRLDLDWRWCKRARELGVPVGINPDAHDVRGLRDVQHGVVAARRGWLGKDDVLNTRSWDDVRNLLRL